MSALRAVSNFFIIQTLGNTIVHRPETDDDTDNISHHLKALGHSRKSRINEEDNKYNSETHTHTPRITSFRALKSFTDTEMKSVHTHKHTQMYKHV